MIDREIANIYDRRSALFLGGAAVLTSILVLRMLQMQLFEYKTYKKKSLANALRIHAIIPKRGEIFSRTGFVLAQDTPIYRAYIIPEEAESLSDTIIAISKELKLKPKEIGALKRKIAKQPKFQPAIIRESLGWTQLAGLQTMGLSGIHIEPGWARSTPIGAATVHVIGYVGTASDSFQNAGLAGLEKVYDAQLAGKAGRTAIINDASGRIVGEEESMSRPARVGTNLRTTIDENIQQALSDGLSAAKSGGGVVLDCQRGDILAMCSAPSFDPNILRTDDGPDYMKSLRENHMKPFMNKAIEGLYPPGSTFKIAVALAALESGAITPTEKIHCPGYWQYGDRTYHCWEKKGHGWEDLSDALAHSCDIYFYQIALRIGIDAIKNMAERLGFGQKLLDLLPKEMAGVIPDRRWKEQNIGARWTHGDTIISGIGQGFVLCNCLQLAVAMARVATNKIIFPRLIENQDSRHDANLGLQKKNIKIVLWGLARVLQTGGTAAANAINVNGQRMGGKTGTSQVRSISEAERKSGVLTNDQLNWAQRNHGLFVGFAPLDHPKYTVACITEHTGNSGPAALAAAAAMKEALKA